MNSQGLDRLIFNQMCKLSSMIQMCEVTENCFEVWKHFGELPASQQQDPGSPEYTATVTSRKQDRSVVKNRSRRHSHQSWIKRLYVIPATRRGRPRETLKFAARKLISASATTSQGHLWLWTSLRWTHTQEPRTSATDCQDLQLSDSFQNL